MRYLVIFLFLIGVNLAPSARAGTVVVGNLARKTTIKPGDAFEGVIFVKNTGAEASEAQIRQTDYSFQADGSNDYGQPGTLPRSNADWITVTPTRVKLAPGETVPVRYKGRAPSGPKLQGTFWSMIMVEPNSAPPITPAGTVDKISVGLQTAVRFGVQIITEIGQAGTRSLTIRDKGILQAEGQRTLHLDIANDGERLLVPLTTVELFDAQGASIGRFDAGRTSIFPTCSVRARVNLTDVPSGKYTAMVLLDSGDAQVLGAQYDLVLAPEDLAKHPRPPLAKNEAAGAK